MVANAGAVTTAWAGATDTANPQIAKKRLCNTRRIISLSGFRQCDGHSRERDHAQLCSVNQPATLRVSQPAEISTNRAAFIEPLKIQEDAIQHADPHPDHVRISDMYGTPETFPV
jgi:hypothetical protein